MAGPLRVERDVEVARWVQRSLADFGSVAANVPPIFDAYARILPPATLETPVLRDGGTVLTDAWGTPQYASRAITWAEAAGLLGERTGEREPWTAWEARFGEHAQELPDGSRLSDGRVLPDGSRIAPPHGLEIPVELLATLTGLLLDEHGDAEVLAAVWEGRGLDPSGTGGFFAFPPRTSRWVRRREARRLEADLHAELTAAVDPEVLAAMREQHVLGLPREGQGRGHVLLRGRLASFADPAWVESAGLGWRRTERHVDPGRTPNAIWPVEPAGAPAWFVAADLDLDVTLVGGSAQLIGRLLAHPAIEAERIRPTDSQIDARV